MNLLLNSERAVFEDSKLVSYALDPQSERGQHKARVFESILGFTLSNWEQLRQAILESLPYQCATFTSETVFGKKYAVISSITGPSGRTAEVITIWQFDRLPDGIRYADVPRLVTLYIP